MSLTGLCQLCESATAEFRCELCGAPVCDDHYDRAVGACLQCARGTGDPADDADVLR
ncbi:MAG: hypothetical protein ABEI75_01385 [Halobaculum sp.]